MFYILEGKTSVKVECAEWGMWFEKTHRHVDQTEIDGHLISTVFLGLDHNYFGGRPLIFETMIFDRKGDDIYQTRYSTWDEAAAGHLKASNWLTKKLIGECDDEMD